MDLSKFVDALKLSPKYLVPISLVSGFLLFGSPQYITTLGLDSFVNSYRSWIGLVFLIATALVITQLIYEAWSWLKSKYDRSKSKRVAQKRLHDLTLEEKVVLSGYIFQGTKTQVLDFTNGVITGLEHAEIIYQAASVGSIIDGFAYNIQPWAWKYLNKHKELLVISEKGETDTVKSPTSIP